MGSMGQAPTAATTDSFEDEPPLMEELGIDLQQIYQVRARARQCMWQVVNLGK